MTEASTLKFSEIEIPLASERLSLQELLEISKKFYTDFFKSNQNANSKQRGI